MTLREIVVAWLESEGLDGLCAKDCGCGIDDLFPCESPQPNYCHAAICGETDDGDQTYVRAVQPRPWHVVDKEATND